MAKAKSKTGAAALKKSKPASSNKKKSTATSSKAKSLNKKSKPAPKKAAGKSSPTKTAAKPGKSVAKKVVRKSPPVAPVRKGKTPPKKAAKPAARPVAKKGKSTPPKKTSAKGSKNPIAKQAAKVVKAVKAVAVVATKKAVKPVKAALKTAAVVAAAAAPLSRQQPKSGLKVTEIPPRPVVARPPEPKKAPRRPRTRIPVSEGGPIAAWIQVGERPRPSSFIPAPPRAESPSQIAAAPASSDRLIRADDLQSLNLPAIRTFPIRVEIEQSVGRTHILVQPDSVDIRPGDGLEWDFRYLGGADTFVDEVVIDFGDEKPFAGKILKSRNPGSARPHRQLSGRLSDKATKGPIFYTVRCHAFGSELAKSTASIVVG